MIHIVRKMGFYGDFHVLMKVMKHPFSLLDGEAGHLAGRLNHESHKGKYVFCCVKNKERSIK